MDKGQEPAITLNQFRNTKTGEEWEPLCYVDSTPDDGYVLRILQAHLDNQETGEWVADPPSPLIDFMNKCSKERAELLRKAIAELSKPQQ